MKLRAVSILAAALVVVLGLVGLSAIKTKTVAEAADATRFDPGLIISDSVFFDFGSMTEDAIQRFLESQVPNCKAVTGQPKCLRDYTTNIPETIGVAGHCGNVAADTAVKASSVIYRVARACGVNPRVLIVLLQKEQGLVQATNPSLYMYRAATGYGCPDSDPAICGRVFAGLFNQLYKAAGQFKWYGNPNSPFKRLKVGSVSNILYNPKSSCGTAPVMIKSQATADLYYYTPYTPNAAALKNLYGTGDSCSAYGNRNFWRFYSDWFGSTIGGGFLLKSATSDVYLIVNNYKYVIKDADLIAAMKPLGPLGTISQDYLDSFITSSLTLTRIIKSATGQYYFVDAGQKYPLASCTQATDLGLDCTKAVQLTATQLASLPTGAAMTQHVAAADGSEYLIRAGLKQQILDGYSATSAGITLEELAPVKITAFGYLPWGAPIANDKTLFLNSTTKSYGLYVDNAYYLIDKALYADVNFAKWFTMSSGTLSNDGLSKVASGINITPFVSDPDGKVWLITSDGRVEVTGGGRVVQGTATVSTALLRTITATTKTLDAPTFVQGAGDKKIYYMNDALRRATYSAADRALLATGMDSGAVFALSASALAQLKLGAPIYAPGDVLHSSKSGIDYWVNSYNSIVKIGGSKNAAQFGLSTIKPITVAAIPGYTAKQTLAGVKVICDTQYYVAIAGRYYAISTADVAHYPGSAVRLSEVACTRLTKSTVILGRFIRTPDKKFWLVQKGKRRVFATTAKYQALRGAMLPAVAVDATFAAKLAIGLPAPSTLIEPTPTPTPTASRTATPTATPTPTPSPTVRTYKVVAGDTLTKIAVKFATTVAILKSLNNLTSDVITVGQILKLP